jgi:HEPN domain-containing protein
MPRNNWRDLLTIAKEDHEIFIVLLHREGTPIRVSCFHAQQAVEKYFKVVLSFRDIDYYYTHDLVILVEILEANGFYLPVPLERLAILNPFAVQMRYDIKAVPPVKPEEVEEIVDLIANWCKKQLHD